MRRSPARSRAVRVGIALTITAAAPAGPALGDAGAGAEPGGATRITYVAPAGCPGRDAFEAAVHERLPAARFTTGFAARGFTITIAATEDGYAGTLATGAGDGDTGRRLAAHDCDDVVAALALITALAIDPSAAVTATRAAPPPRPPPAPPGPRRWSLAAIASGELAGGVTPDALWTGALGVRLARRGLGHVTLEAVAGRDTARTDAGEARFTLLVGRASGCWQAVGRPVEVDACAILDAGALRAQGIGVVRGQDLVRPYLAIGAAAAVRWPRTSRAFLEFRTGVAVPLVRDRFVFTPDVLIHQTAVATPWASLGGGARFW